MANEVWLFGRAMSKGRTHSTVFGKGSMTDVCFRDDILIPYIGFFKYVFVSNFILLDFNVSDRANLIYMIFSKIRIIV